ncbi:SAG1386/EF1546 family surface-associated protein [Furfurilactobacillus sp. WILCCON 0119]
MSQNNDPRDQKPWDKQFTEDNGESSRTAARKRNSHNSWITTVLVLAIICLAAIPVWYFVSNMNTFNHPQNSAQVAVSSSKKKASSSSSSSKKASSAKSSSAKSESSSSSVSEEASSATSSSAESSSSSSSSSDEKYVTVESGQGLYRVAVNNGLTLQQLLTLNGLSSSSQVAPGQQLRVK